MLKMGITWLGFGTVAGVGGETMASGHLDSNAIIVVSPRKFNKTIKLHLTNEFAGLFLSPEHCMQIKVVLVCIWGNVLWKNVLKDKD